MLLDVLIWLENLTPFIDLRSSAYVYPIVLALHLTTISLFGAMIVATDLRLLGLTLTDSPFAQVIRELRWPKRVGFLLAATCGFLLFASNAETYYYNPYFRIKVLLFVLVAIHALLFRRSVYAESANGTLMQPRAAKVAASLSLVLWLGILFAGRAIGYVVARPGMHFH